MRKFTLPHTVRWVAVCFGCIVGSLIFQGCSDDSTPAQTDPYAALDQAFPDGRKEATSPAKRAQNLEYMAKINAGAENFSALSNDVAAIDAEIESVRKQIAAALSKRMGEDVPDVLLEEELQKLQIYRELTARRAEAVAARDAQKAANIKLIREEMNAGFAKYDAMRAEADAKARAAGLPVRGEQEATKANAK
jgi:hypothetical protein